MLPASFEFCFLPPNHSLHLASPDPQSPDFEYQEDESKFLVFVVPPSFLPIRCSPPVSLKVVFENLPPFARFDFLALQHPFVILDRLPFQSPLNVFWKASHFPSFNQGIMVKFFVKALFPPFDYSCST